MNAPRGRADTFGQRRMDVDGTSDGAVGSIDDHRDDLFVDQVASVGSDNVATEHTISVCVGDELNETAVPPIALALATPANS
ncbi:MAG: hypothetical protein M3415_03930 [Actinomycetota bacterium]|nr:hypothetical protein [Actinomycetota bacterium]